MMAERASMEIGSTTTDDIAQTWIAPHDVDMGAVGLVRVFHADAINVGLVEEGDADPRISILIGLQGCQCGCNAPGCALLVTPSPQHAREIGQSLIRHADDMERRAKASADSWLTKITKGPQA